MGFGVGALPGADASAVGALPGAGVSAVGTLPGAVTTGWTTVVTGSGAPSFAPGGGQSSAEGSGFVIDSKGDIITNAHVVDGASSIKVRFQNGRTAKATLVGSDDSTDVAVIKVNTDGSVSNCRIARSSGNPSADSLMCQLTLRYIRFQPARDASGRPVAQDVTFFPSWWRP